MEGMNEQKEGREGEKAAESHLRLIELNLISSHRSESLAHVQKHRLTHVRVVFERGNVLC